MNTVFKYPVEVFGETFMFKFLHDMNFLILALYNRKSQYYGTLESIDDIKNLLSSVFIVEGGSYIMQSEPHYSENNITKQAEECYAEFDQVCYGAASAKNKCIEAFMNGYRACMKNVDPSYKLKS